MKIRKWYTEGNIQDIADAIREKDGTEELMLVEDMAERIQLLPSNKEVEELGAQVAVLTETTDGLSAKLDSVTTLAQSLNVRFGEVENLIDQKIKTLGTASKYNAGTSPGMVPIIGSNGKLPLYLMPIQYTEGSGGTGSNITQIEGVQWGAINGSVEEQFDLITYLFDHYASKSDTYTQYGQIMEEMNSKSTHEEITSLLDTLRNEIYDKGYVDSSYVSSQGFATMSELASMHDSLSSSINTESTRLQEEIERRPTEDDVKAIVDTYNFHESITRMGSDAITVANGYTDTEVVTMKDSIMTEVEDLNMSLRGDIQSEMLREINSATNSALGTARSELDEFKKETMTRSEIFVQFGVTRDEFTTSLGNAVNDLQSSFSTSISDAVADLATMDDVTLSVEDAKVHMEQAMGVETTRLEQTISLATSTMMEYTDNEITNLRGEFYSKTDVDTKIDSAVNSLGSDLRNYVDGFDHDHSPFVTLETVRKEISDETTKFVTRVDMDSAMDSAVSQANSYADDTFIPKSEMNSFAKLSDLSGYLSKTDLSLYATKSDLNDYATQTELQYYATRSDLTEYASKSDLTEYAKDSAVTTLASQLESKLGYQALYTVLNDYVPKDTYQSKIQAIESEIEQLSNVPVVTPAEVKSEVESSLSEVNRNISEANTSIQTLRSTVSSLESDLNSMSARLGDFATNSDLNGKISRDELNNYQVKGDYVTSSDISNYVDNAINSNSTIIDKVSTNELMSYLNDYASYDSVSNLSSEISMVKSSVDELVSSVIKQDNWEYSTIGDALRNIQERLDSLESRVSNLEYR